MPNADLPASQEPRCQSVETTRDHLLRFLRLIAKDVVHQLAKSNSGPTKGDDKSASSRQAR